MPEKYLITTAPKDGSLIEVRFVQNEWLSVRWTDQLGGNWRREDTGTLCVPGGGCVPGEWERIGRWRPLIRVEAQK